MTDIAEQDSLEARLRRTAEELIEPPTGNIGGVRVDAAKQLREAADTLCQMRAVLAECANDLEAEVTARWRTEPDGSCHPALQAKLDRDLTPVVKARALLTTTKIETSHE